MRPAVSHTVSLADIANQSWHPPVSSGGTSTFISTTSKQPVLCIGRNQFTIADLVILYVKLFENRFLQPHEKCSSCQGVSVFTGGKKTHSNQLYQYIKRERKRFWVPIFLKLVNEWPFLRHLLWQALHVALGTAGCKTSSASVFKGLPF